MSDLAECALCCNTFKEEPQERVPRSLPCGHTFCHECLSRLVIRNSVECPNRCTVNANLGVEGVAGLPRNFALIDTLRARRPPDAGSTELARLEEEKRRAVEAEDYDLAKKLKVEIDALKAAPGGSVMATLQAASAPSAYVPSVTSRLRQEAVRMFPVEVASKTFPQPGEAKSTSSSWEAVRMFPFEVASTTFPKPGGDLQGRVMAAPAVSALVSGRQGGCIDTPATLRQPIARSADAVGLSQDAPADSKRRRLPWTRNASTSQDIHISSEDKPILSEDLPLFNEDAHITAGSSTASTCRAFERSAGEAALLPDDAVSKASVDEYGISDSDYMRIDVGQMLERPAQLQSSDCGETGQQIRHGTGCTTADRPGFASASEPAAHSATGLSPTAQSHEGYVQMGTSMTTMPVASKQGNACSGCMGATEHGCAQEDMQCEAASRARGAEEAQPADAIGDDWLDVLTNL
mmetsp:Transcript_32337/g.56556  ORF Transcript_32337/g.56556 Transcript_32337/m.56556 type:complete len:464 (+) Transcript_32337:56-1447(+)